MRRGLMGWSEAELPLAVVRERLSRLQAALKSEGLGAQEGSGNDWRCTVYWSVPGNNVTAQAIYQLDVTANGRYIADGDGPVEVV